MNNTLFLIFYERQLYTLEPVANGYALLKLKGEDFFDIDEQDQATALTGYAEELVAALGEDGQNLGSWRIMLLSYRVDLSLQAEVVRKLFNLSPERLELRSLEKILPEHLMKTGKLLPGQPGEIETQLAAVDVLHTFQSAQSPVIQDNHEAEEVKAELSGWKDRYEKLQDSHDEVSKALEINRLAVVRFQQEHWAREEKIRQRQTMATKRHLLFLPVPPKFKDYRNDCKFTWVKPNGEYVEEKELLGFAEFGYTSEKFLLHSPAIGKLFYFRGGAIWSFPGRTSLRGQIDKIKEMRCSSPYSVKLDNSSNYLYFHSYCETEKDLIKRKIAVGILADQEDDPREIYDWVIDQYGGLLLLEHIVALQLTLGLWPKL